MTQRRSTEAARRARGNVYDAMKYKALAAAVLALVTVGLIDKLGCPDDQAMLLAKRTLVEQAASKGISPNLMISCPQAKCRREHPTNLRTQEIRLCGRNGLNFWEIDVTLNATVGEPFRVLKHSSLTKVALCVGWPT